MIRHGTVISNTLKTAKMIAVEFDNGDVNNCNIDSYRFRLEPNKQLELEFQSLFKKHKPDFDKKIKELNKVKKELEDLCENLGLPTYVNGETYIPKSFNIKHKIDLGDMSDLINIPVWYADETGWQSSTNSC